MLLGTRQRNLKQDDNIFIELDNTRLERVLITKFLGVVIDEISHGKNHIDGIT